MSTFHPTLLAPFLASFLASFLSKTVCECHGEFGKVPGFLLHHLRSENLRVNVGIEHVMKETFDRIVAHAGDDGAVPHQVVEKFAQGFCFEAAQGQDAFGRALDVFVGQVHQLEQAEGEVRGAGADGGPVL